jgi:hypothetical protein
LGSLCTFTSQTLYTTNKGYHTVSMALPVKYRKYTRTHRKTGFLPSSPTPWAPQQLLKNNDDVKKIGWNNFPLSTLGGARVLTGSFTGAHAAWPAHVVGMRQSTPWPHLLYSTFVYTCVHKTSLFTPTNPSYFVFFPPVALTIISPVPVYINFEQRSRQ